MLAVVIWIFESPNFYPGDEFASGGTWESAYRDWREHLSTVRILWGPSKTGQASPLPSTSRMVNLRQDDGKGEGTAPKSDLLGSCNSLEQKAGPGDPAVGSLPPSGCGLQGHSKQESMLPEDLGVRINFILRYHRCITE